MEYKYYCKECIDKFFAQSNYRVKVQFCPICGSKDIFIINPTEEGSYQREKKYD